MKIQHSTTFKANFIKNKKVVNEIAAYPLEMKVETLNFLKKLNEVKDNKLWEYTGRTIIEAGAKKYTYFYAEETTFLHRLKDFVRSRYPQCFDVKEDVDKEILNLLQKG